MDKEVNENNTQTEIAQEQSSGSIDIENMSDEEFQENFDQIAETLMSEPQRGDTSTMVNANEVNHEVNNQNESVNIDENQEPQDGEHPNSDSKPYIPDDFDIETFNSIPDQYKRLFQPIKANGIEIQPDPDKFIQLVQLGSKYYADREKVKPMLKTVKVLEKEGIDEEKMNLLIDAYKGNKEALISLMKQNEIDPLDIDIDDDIEYQPTNYNINENEIALEEVINELEQTPTYETLTNEVSSMDEVSKEFLKSNPEVLKILNEHIGTGVYGEVMNKVKEAKIFGKFHNVPLIDAYKMTLDEIIQQNQQTSQGGSEPQTSLNVNDAGNQVVDQHKQQVQQAMQQIQQPQYNIPSGSLTPENTVMHQQTQPVDINNIDVGALSDEEYLRLLNSL